MKNIIFFTFLIFPFLSISQKHDYNWLFGYEGDAGVEEFGISQLNFNHNPVLIEKQDSAFMKIDVSHASISDSLGNLLFYTNGCYIADKNHQMMPNSDGLNPGILHNTNCDFFGYTGGVQSCLILPYPKQVNLYYLIHNPMTFHSQFGYHAPKLFYTLVDMDDNGGLGTVIEKNMPIVLDTLTPGNITAVKHTNGRDWWIINPQFDNNKYYRTLLGINGLEEPLEQIIGDSISTGSSHAVFSPDGTTYIRYSPEEQLNIYDFDRSTGLLSNARNISFDAPPPSSSGISVSPNSRFLYLSNTNWLLQFDLEAVDIAESMVVIDTFDGFQSPFATQFFLAQLAPDCKIYISSFSSVDVLHVINQPDRKGLACDFQQHAIDLPTLHGGSMPHFPNYRLGTTPTYPCDSTIVLTGTSFVPPPPDWGIQVYPNPARESMTISCEWCKDEGAVLQVHNLMGQLVLEQTINTEQSIISVAHLAAGAYICTLSDSGSLLSKQKIVVVK